MDQAVEGGRLPLETWFWEMPVCTRWWTAATIITSVLVQCRVVSALQLYYSFRAVFSKSQVPISRSTVHRVSYTNPRTLVLAIIDDISLLRSPLGRSVIPCIFPATIRAPPRGVCWPFDSTLLMVVILRHG